MISALPATVKPATPISGLRRRIVAYVILASTLFSILASGVQLFLGFQRDRNAILSGFEIIETSFLQGLENAL